MKIVVLTGAGVSQPSGIKTFRDAGGLWEGHRIEDVASPEGWKKNPQVVLDFYNARRTQLATVAPNAAHIAIAEWQVKHDVTVITQNVDDLHQRAGSKNVIHLHGELTKARSTINSDLVQDIGYQEIKNGDVSKYDGSQLRPHIVWFGENVSLMEEAHNITKTADAFIVVGTSLQVYPAAGLLEFAPKNSFKVYVDAKPDIGLLPPDFHTITNSAEIGVPLLGAHLDRVNR